MLWMSRRPTRWFVVPDDAPWPDGSDEVQDIGGSLRAVDLEALVAYRVSSQEARDTAERMTHALQAKLDARLAAAAERQAADPAKPPAEQVAELLQPLADRLATREAMAAFLGDLGLDLDRLEAASADELGTMARDILGPLVKAFEDPAAREGALDAMQGALRAHGMPEAAERLAAAPDEVRQALDALKAT